MERDGLVSLDHVRTERAEIEETGEYDLEGFVVRLGYAIESIARSASSSTRSSRCSLRCRTSSFPRAETGRMFRWLNEQGMSAIVTAERGEGKLTHYGLEEYVSDCVSLLDNRVSARSQRGGCGSSRTAAPRTAATSTVSS